MALTLTRRTLVRSAAGLAAFVAAPSALAAMPSLHLPKRRELKLLNTHTGETFAGTYWADGRHVSGALGAIRRVLRDHRTGEQHDIDPRLLDLLVSLRGALDSSQSFHVISGYRSAATNARMARKGSGVAKHSLHPLGQAIEYRLPGRSLPGLRDAALRLAQGGVGYYPDSDFVHVDVGRVRRW